MNVTTWTSQKLHDLELSATCVGHLPLTGQCDNKGATGSWRDLLLADLQTLDSLNSARNTGETASRRYSTWKDEQSPSQLKFFPNSCGGGGPSGEDRNLDPLNLSRRKNLLGGLLPQAPLSFQQAILLVSSFRYLHHGPAPSYAGSKLDLEFKSQPCHSLAFSKSIC